MAISQLYPNQRPTLNLNFARSKTLDSRITFSRGGCAGTYVGSNGLIKTAAVDEPRFDHDPVTGDCRGLLIEELRTNRITESQNFAVSYMTLGPSVVRTPNSGIAPDGTNTATKIHITSGANAGIGIGLGANVGNATTSIYAKAAGKNWIALYDAYALNKVFFDLANGVKGSRDSEIGEDDYSIEPVGNGWYRCSVYRASTGNHFCGVMAGDGVNSLSCTPNGTDGGLIWGSQLEVGTFPTSYIPTSGSTYQRKADEAEITGTNFSSWYNQSEGTVQVKYSSPTDTSSAYKRLVSISDSSQNTMSANNGFLYGSHSPSTSTRWMARNGASIWYVALASPASLSSAIAYQDDNLAVSYDGATVLTNTSFTVSSLPSRLDFYPNGHISRLAYYNTRLSNTALEALTK